MTEQSADSLLMGGATFASWAVKNELGQYQTKPYGSKVSGTIAAIGEPQQQTDWDTGALLTWPDGKPRMQFAVTLDVDWSNTIGEVQADGSDTQRSVMVKQSSAIQAALRDAIKTAGGTGLQTGAYATFTLTGEQPSNKGNPVKTFAVQYSLPAQGMVMEGGPQPQQAQQMPPQQVPQQQPPAQQMPNQATPVQQGYQQQPQVPQQPQQQAPQQPNPQDPTVIARKLLHELNLPAEQVAQQTGLPLETVQQLPPF